MSSKQRFLEQGKNILFSIQRYLAIGLIASVIIIGIYVFQHSSDEAKTVSVASFVLLFIIVVVMLTGLIISRHLKQSEDVDQ